MQSNGNLVKRQALFMLGCIPMRLFIGHVVSQTDDKTRVMYGVILLCIGFGFWYIYTNNLRKTGVEVFGDVIWWDKLRPVHGTLYILAGYYLLQGDNRSAANLIGLDTAVGVVAFVMFHGGMYGRL